MPREQINTPARRVVVPLYDTPDGNLPVLVDGAETAAGAQISGWGFHYPVEGEAYPENGHWENTPTLYLAWDGQGHQGQPGDASVQFTFEIDADEVLRAAADIQRRRDMIAAGSAEIGFGTWQFRSHSLPRTELQHLIRVTKRARDVVFGADE